MKKTLTLILATVISTNIFAQLKAGLKFSPTFALNSVIDNSGTESGEEISYDKSSFGLRYSTGLNLDFQINESLVFGTGLWFTVKRTGIHGQKTILSITTKEWDEVYNLQYLQVPLTLKMYTNEIATDMKLYFQLGPSLDIRINEKILSNKNIEDMEIYQSAKASNRAVFSYFDISIIGGAGVEWQMANNTALFAGLSYNRGLLNTFNPYLQWNGTSSYVDADITNKTSAISIDLGVKF